MTLEELEKTLAAMIPGPWVAAAGSLGRGQVLAEHPAHGMVIVASVESEPRRGIDNAAGIATLRNIAAELIAVAQAAEREAVCTCADRGWAAYPRRHAPDCPAHLCGETRDALDALDAALARLAPPEPED